MLRVMPMTYGVGEELGHLLGSIAPAELASLCGDHSRGEGGLVRVHGDEEDELSAGETAELGLLMVIDRGMGVRWPRLNILG